MLNSTTPDSRLRSLQDGLNAKTRALKYQPDNRELKRQREQLEAELERVLSELGSLDMNAIKSGK